VHLLDNMGCFIYKDTDEDEANLAKESRFFDLIVV
jgi:hypothetical protein